MISLEEVRQVVTAEFQRVHELNYPTMPVDYANFQVVDVEHQRLPFVVFDLRIDESARGELGEREIFVRGTLSPIFYYMQGRGGQGHLEYMDMLNRELGMQILNSVHYHAVRPTQVSTFPGGGGALNSIKFDVVASSCEA
jgi:hypothetical protein